MRMQQWLIATMTAYGYLGVFLLILIENVFPPIPSEVILAFGGFMTTQAELSVPWMILWATLGSYAGAVVLYGVGALLGSGGLNKLVAKWGKYIHLKQTDLEKAIAWYGRYERKTVFFCRMVPVLRSLISIPAGIAKMNFLSFSLLTVIGSAIWNTLLVVAGAALGEAWPKVAAAVEGYSTVIYVVFGAAAAALFVYWLYHRRRKGRPAEKP